MKIKKNSIDILLSNKDEENLLISYLTSPDYEVSALKDISATKAHLFILDAPTALMFEDKVLSIKKISQIFIPAIIILNREDDEDIWLSKGYDFCLRKPFTEQELKAYIKLLLQLRHHSKKFTIEGEAKYRAIFEATGNATIITDEDATILMANAECLPVTGYTPEELIGTKWTKYVAPESLQMMIKYHIARREHPTKAPKRYEAKLINKKGEVRIALLDIVMIPNTKQSVVSMLDITEHKRTEIEIKKQRELLQRIFDNMPLMITYFDERGNIKLVNQEVVNTLGWSFEEWKTENILKRCYPNPEAYNEALNFMINKPKGWKDFKTTTKYGTVLDISWTNILLPDGVSIAIGQDITERKRADESANKALMAWQETFDLLSSSIWVMSKEQKILYANKATEHYFNRSWDEIIGKHCWEIVHKTIQQIPECPVLKALKTLKKESIEMKANGRYFEVIVEPIVSDGNLQGFVHIISDITDRKKAEEALYESEKVYRTLFEDHSAVKILLNPDTADIVDANKAASRFYGWSREELKKMNIQQINTLPAEEFYAELEKARTSQKTYFEFKHRLSDNSIRDVRVFSSKVHIKSKDYLHSIIQDVTKEKQLEAQLYQTQKLEAIGKLAGGIAHDFNNMLNIILGYSEIMMNKLHQKDPLRDDVHQIIEAANRSKSLTQQLLAFSRKQILNPQIINVNDILNRMQKMLERLIGEDIQLISELAHNLSYIKADPSQIEQVILNLAVNARDAMPYGGKLIIETDNVYLDEEYAQTHTNVIPGEYVMIAITDTGKGIDKETLPYIFEPFFTTKDKDKGIGLGLSTVYGIIKQTGGNIWVYSELEKGTTFKIYIPITLEKPQIDKKNEERKELRGGGQHILVVEDETGLRGLFEALITNLGYRVTVASNGGEALLLIEEKGLMPDLIITDVIMPVLSGADLVNRLKKNIPDLKVLYMSGYTSNAIVHHGVLDEGKPFIQKPFNINELALKIEELLKGS